jgi:hypothetical protein
MLISQCHGCHIHALSDTSSKQNEGYSVTYCNLHVLNLSNVAEMYQPQFHKVLKIIYHFSRLCLYHAVVLFICYLICHGTTAER